MTFMEIAARRESCRNFEDKPVEQEKLMKIAETARLAPSACNSQPWKMVIVNEREQAAKTAKCLQDKILPINQFTNHCPAFIVICEESANVLSKAGGKVKDQKYAEVDIGLLAAHICFTAVELGLGTCIIGWLNEGKLQELLQIPKNRRIRLVIAVGYPKSGEPRKKSRKPLEEILSFGQY